MSPGRRFQIAVVENDRSTAIAREPSLQALRRLHWRPAGSQRPFLAGRCGSRPARHCPGCVPRRHRMRGRRPAPSPTTRSCQPPGVLTNWWIGRASKNSFATRRTGPSGMVSNVSWKAGFNGAPASVLSWICLRRGLVSTRCRTCRGNKARTQRRHPQKIGHQGSASWTQFHQMEGRRFPQTFEGRNTGGADKFPEHLADFRSSHKVAFTAKRFPRSVVTQFRVSKADGHVLRDRPSDPSLAIAARIFSFRSVKPQHSPMRGVRPRS